MQNQRHEFFQIRRIWPPEPGYFQIRYVRGGPGVPAEITRDADGLWQAIIDGDPRQPHADPTLARDVARIWHSGLRLPRADYEHFLTVKAWAAQHWPEHPCLWPYQPINYAKIPPLMPPDSAATDTPGTRRRAQPVVFSDAAQ